MPSHLAPELAMLDALSPEGESQAVASRAVAVLEGIPDDAPLSLMAGQTRVDLAGLPPELRHMLEDLLRELGRGHTVVLSSTQEEEVSTGEAGKMLEMSRTHVVNLVDRGILPARTMRHGSGSHRRLRLSDVLAFRHRRQQSATGLVAIEQLSDELDLYALDRDEPPYRPRSAEE